MNTIRRRLTLHLLILWGVLLSIGGGIAYSVTRTALTRHFDEALHAKAAALAGQIEEHKRRIVLEISAQFKGEFDTDGSAFFQISDRTGRVIARSNSLHDESLPVDLAVTKAPKYWDLKVNSQLEARATTMLFQPRRANEGEEVKNSRVEDREDQVRNELLVVLAVDRRTLDDSLSSLAIVLAGSGLFVLVLTTVAVPLLLRHKMAPLDRLSDQTQRITAESLDVRFPTAGLPGELTPIATRLNGLLERLQVSFERERHFSDDLAHELRTPIAEIRSFAELALKWPDGRPADTDQNVLDIALQMEKTVSRLLLIARSDGGQTALAHDRVELASFLGAICESYQARVLERHLLVNVRIPHKLQLEIDAVALRAILSNLFENAVEYSPIDSAIQIQSELNNGDIVLSMTNSVQRLSREDVPYLFERFWRKDAARTGGQHTGLGLSIARALATTIGFTLSATFQDDNRLTMQLRGAAILLHQSTTTVQETELATEV
jgi:two-component system sensor histidine kinase QseC